MTATDENPTRCYWVCPPGQDPIVIPMCMARAQDPEACTCDTPRSQLEAMQEEVREAREMVKIWFERLTRCRHDNERLLEINRRYRATLFARGLPR